MEKPNSEREKKAYLRLRTARRSMMYVVRTLLLVIAGVLVCALAFFTTERMSNLYILSSEGMALRAACVLGGSQKADLEEYFLLTCIAEDERLQSDDYRNYTVSSYNYDLEVEKVFVLPWSATATVTAVETVRLKGTINPDLIEEGKSAADYPLPPWNSGRYRIHFVNTGERWYISELELLEENPAIEPLRTPDLSQSVLPMATPTPTPEPDMIVTVP